MSTVLIVDDEPGVRDGLARAVSSKGHRAVPVPSLAEARRVLLAEPVDCVLLDVRLKDGDGLDLLREIREGAHRDTPVIMATAYGDSERTIRAMKEGAFEYVTKPFDLPALLDALERAVKKSALRRTVSGAPTAAASSQPDNGLVGASAAMLAVWKVIGRAAA